jgi:hypothetical protein
MVELGECARLNQQRQDNRASGKRANGKAVIREPDCQEANRGSLLLLMKIS